MAAQRRGEQLTEVVVHPVETGGQSDVGERVVARRSIARRPLRVFPVKIASRLRFADRVRTSLQVGKTVAPIRCRRCGRSDRAVQIIAAAQIHGDAGDTRFAHVVDPVVIGVDVDRSAQRRRSGGRIRSDGWWWRKAAANLHDAVRGGDVVTVAVSDAVLREIEASVRPGLHQIAAKTAARERRDGQRRRRGVVVARKVEPGDRAVLIVRDDEFRRIGMDADTYRVRAHRDPSDDRPDAAGARQHNQLPRWSPVGDKKERTGGVERDPVDVADLSRIERGKSGRGARAGIEVPQRARGECGEPRLAARACIDKVV